MIFRVFKEYGAVGLLFGSAFFVLTHYKLALLFAVRDLQTANKRFILRYEST